MATFKFNAIQRYGKLYGALFKATDAPLDPLQNAALDNNADLASWLSDQIAANGLDEEEDTVIFRNNSYNDFVALERAVRMASY